MIALQALGSSLISAAKPYLVRANSEAKKTVPKGAVV
jgi:hypothetical protein